MMKAQRHLSDDRLIEVCLESAPAHGELQHLDSCVECQGRRADIALMLMDISQAAADEADAVFPAERLTRQHARILQRLEHEGRPGRVIAFPAGYGSDAYVLRTRPAMRWIAGAAAAGLVIGLLAGHLAHDFSVIRPGRAAQLAIAARPAPDVPTLHAVATTISEDDFLGQIDLAIEGSGSTSLRPLDELTPRAWEVTIP
jgi:hypothetical protein